MSEPRLTGRRLGLRALIDGDAPALLDAVAATRAQLKKRFAWVESATGVPEMLAFIRSKAQDAEAARSLTFGIFEAKSQKLVGIVSLDAIEVETLKAKMALWVRSDEQDKGYAVEAGRLAVEHAFRKLALHRLYSRIDPVNRAARKVLQKLGFRYEGCLRQDKRLYNRWVDQECWGVLRGDWKPMHPKRGPK